MTPETPQLQRMTVDDRFFELYDRMIGEVELAAVLRDVADVVCQSLESERATVYLVEPETSTLAAAAVVGNVSQIIRVPIDEHSLAGFCALTGRTFSVPDAYGDLGGIDSRLQFDRSWDRVNDFRTRDVLCAPAVFKDETVGVVQAVNSRGTPFGDEDLASLRAIARLVGYALYHARLYDDLVTMKRLEKEKAGFLRIMVHELKSPVAAARMLTSALSDKVAGDPQARTLADRVGNRMDRMLEMVGEMLTLARVKSGEPMGDIGVLDLATEVRSCCDLYRDPCEAKGLRLDVVVPQGAVRVRFDTQALALVLSNLVSNAVKYTEAGSVTVTVDADEEHALLTVADTGMGIPEKDMAKLFTEFFRASNAKKAKIPGSGVGLSGVKQLVERFDGQLRLTTCEGQGSTFAVRLPLHDG
ncbi:MAG: GAF domain-containing sensor histidine kinase [Planctomycetes bacterium]|nr:GAF domain-containing sensor histidine kinase [Planctomycetota bacterium]